MDEPLEQVRHLVQDVSRSRRVDPQTRLWHDLHLGGDDAVELLECIAAKFGTSFAPLSFTDFFPEEHEALGAHLAATFGFRSVRNPVTVQHLADVVKRGVWFDPPKV